MECVNCSIDPVIILNHEVRKVWSQLLDRKLIRASSKGADLVVIEYAMQYVVRLMEERGISLGKCTFCNEIIVMGCDSCSKQCCSKHSITLCSDCSGGRK